MGGCKLRFPLKSRAACTVGKSEKILYCSYPSRTLQGFSIARKEPNRGGSDCLTCLCCVDCSSFIRHFCKAENLPEFAFNYAKRAHCLHGRKCFIMNKFIDMIPTATHNFGSLFHGDSLPCPFLSVSFHFCRSCSVLYLICRCILRLLPVTYSGRDVQKRPVWRAPEFQPHHQKDTKQWFRFWHVRPTFEPVVPLPFPASRN